MNIQVNKRIMSIPSNFTVSMLLKHIESPKSVAIFVNDRQLLMAEYEEYKLNENDNVRIIKPLGGG